MRISSANALDRSNSGDFWYVEAGYERPKLLVDLLYQESQLAAVDGSQFSDFDSSTGGLRIEWKPAATAFSPGRAQRVSTGWTTSSPTAPTSRSSCHGN